MSFTTLISPSQLADRLDRNNWVVFDCRFSLADAKAGARAYRLGHIAGSRYADLNEDLSSPIHSYTGRHPLPDFGILAAKLGRWGVSNQTQVIVYDDTGGAFAGRLWWLLRCMGHDRVAVLDGGIGNWQRHDLPLTTVLPKPVATVFRSYLDTRQWLSAGQVRDGLATRTIKLVDARAPERFQGLTEPIDPVAGHIPKALNRPFGLNLRVDSTFLPASELKEAFVHLLGDTTPQQTIHMCGSGVTGCHNLLAMEVAGLSGSRLYAGSWSEWITDQNRPVAAATT